MPPVFWLTVLFVLASGLSAYIGNSWGRKLGKRKLSVFALRPKHTSTFLTILLSMSLSLGLLGSWLLISPRAREAVLYPPAEQAPVRLAQQPASVPARPAAPAAAPTAAAPQAAPDRQVPAERQLPVQTAAAPAQPLSKGSATPRATAPRSATAPLRQTAPAAPVQAVAAKTTSTPARPVAPAAEARPPQGSQPDAPGRGARLALAGSADARGTLPAEGAGKTPPQQKVPAATSQTLFALQVYGGLKPAESQQVLQGVLDLTRDYARLMASAADTAPLLQIQSQELAQSQARLQEAGVYQLQVSLQSGPEGQAMPVRLQIQSLAASPEFDPHELLELARLENGAQRDGSLREALHLAMQRLAEESRQPGSTPKTSTPAASEALLRSASLPFDIINLRRSGSTLQGQIILAGQAANLTEN